MGWTREAEEIREWGGSCRARGGGEVARQVLAMPWQDRDRPGQKQVATLQAQGLQLQLQLQNRLREPVLHADMKISVD